MLISYETFTAYSKYFNDKCDLLICDEGHRLKNIRNKTFNALNNISCLRRIILTGTPVQNNLKELFACISFVNPQRFHSQKRFQCVYANPINKGLEKNSTDQEKALGSSRKKQLMNEISVFLIRRTQEILEKFLPKRNEFIVFLKPTKIQKALYSEALSIYKGKNFGSGLYLNDKKDNDIFSILMTLRKILSHPCLVFRSETSIGIELKKNIRKVLNGLNLYNRSELSGLKGEIDEDEDEEDEKIYQNNQAEDLSQEDRDDQSDRDNENKKSKSSQQLDKSQKKSLNNSIDETTSKNSSSNFKTPKKTKQKSSFLQQSCKLLFTKKIIQNLKDKEKLIIASYSTMTLDILAKFLNNLKVKFTRLDGSFSAKKRKKNIDLFLDEYSGYNIFLLGAKAGGTGLNLVQANRMILFDIDWNPSNDSQVMGRVYRKGQKREVFIYRLIVGGSIEENIYKRQLTKMELSDTIIDEKDVISKFNSRDLKHLFGEMNEGITPFFEKKPDKFQELVFNKVADFCNFDLKSQKKLLYKVITNKCAYKEESESLDSVENEEDEIEDISHDSADENGSQSENKEDIDEETEEDESYENEKIYNKIEEEQKNENKDIYKKLEQEKTKNIDIMHKTNIELENIEDNDNNKNSNFNNKFQYKKNTEIKNDINKEILINSSTNSSQKSLTFVKGNKKLDEMLNPSLSSQSGPKKHYAVKDVENLNSIDQDESDSEDLNCYIDTENRFLKNNKKRSLNEAKKIYKAYSSQED